MKKKKIFRIFHAMIIFMNFINLIHGKINNNIERFLGITTIPNSEKESENVFSDWSSIPTNIKTSTPEVSDSTKDTKSDIPISSSFNDDKTREWPFTGIVPLPLAIRHVHSPDANINKFIL